MLIIADRNTICCDEETIHIQKDLYCSWSSSPPTLVEWNCIYEPDIKHSLMQTMFVLIQGYSMENDSLVSVFVC